MANAHVPRVARTCANPDCGKAFGVKPSRAARGWDLYCSNACAAPARGEAMRAAKALRTPKPHPWALILRAAQRGHDVTLTFDAERPPERRWVCSLALSWRPVEGATAVEAVRKAAGATTSGGR
jgi:hypothetical protein